MANRLWRSKSAVSPVVGVILMVAATIVIAAIVMGFLGGFKTPQRTLDIQLGNAQAYYNDSYWVVTFTIAGSEANVLGPDNTNDIEYTIINSTGVQLTNHVTDVQIIDHSILKIIGSNTHTHGNATDYYYYVNDNHPKLRVVIKYKPNGQLLFNSIVIAYNATS